MRSFFETVPAARWPRSQGRLHVYAVADGAVAEMAATFQQLLAERGVTGLSRQPAAYLHMTIEMIQRYVEDLTEDQLTGLRTALTARIAGVPAFDLQVGPALVAAHSITLDAVPDQPWRQLRHAVRQAAVDALGADAVKPLAGPGRPHVTFGYAVTDVDIEPHLGALNNCRLGRATMPIEQVQLLAVDQNPSVGVYTWPAPLAVLPLGARQ